jgi:poly(3-hydroxybutyrate) depolymerase
LCSGISKSKQQHYEAKGAGHYGIFSGRRWREMVYPQVKAFILSHHVAPKAAVKAPVKALEKAASAPVAKPIFKTATKPVAKPAAKPAAKVASKPVIVQAPQSKVKTTWVAAPKK